MPKEPDKVQFGNPGQEPTEVWKTYPWKIKALDK